MKYIVEYKSFYNEGDIVLIEYWYNDIITPCKIIEKVSKKSFKITHNIPQSEIKNAPDEIIKTSDIIDKFRIKDQ
jgi:hypothetical protein